MKKCNFISVFLGISLLAACACGDEKIEQAYLLSVVRAGESDALVLSTIPSSDAPDQSISTRTLFSEHGISNYGICGVFRGYLIVLENFNELTTRLLAIELKTGKKKLISDSSCEKALLINHHLYFVIQAESQTSNPDSPSHSLIKMDLRTGVHQEVCPLACADPKTVWLGNDFSMAATSDGSKVAVAGVALEGYGINGWECRITVVDSRTGEVTRSPQKFVGPLLQTGARTCQLAPKLFWCDDETLLIASASGSATQKLFLYRSATQSSEEICNLPMFYDHGFDPTFSFGSDGKILARLGSLGLFEIIVQSKKVKECKDLIGGYSLKQEGGRVSLHVADQELASEIDISRIFLSSDPRQIAWLPVAARNGLVLNEPMDLQIYDSSRGARTVMTRTFPYRFLGPKNNLSSVCLWLSDADLDQTSVFNQLGDFSAVPVTPHVDTRLAIHEAVDLSLKTDKQMYFLHEPIELTIAIRNLAATPIQLESRWMKQGLQPFNDLLLLSRNEKKEIRFNEGHAGELNDEFVTIAAGQSKEFHLTVESAEIGPHEFQFRFEQYSLWRGHLKANTKFEVTEGGNEAELKRKKFDRLVLQSQREFRNNPSGLHNRERFLPLGSSSLPWLIEYLQKIEDSEYRRYLGCELPAIADETTLPFLKGLLETDLKVDGDMLIQSLWSIYLRGDFATRPVPETILLLIEAGKHRNFEVRRKAVATLCHCVNEAVDAFMQKAAEDNDAEVALKAARYVAARQQLPLQTWLTEARFTMTPAGLVAARSIVGELEQLSQEKHGRLPDGTFDEVIADLSKMAEYSATLKAWTLYCATHPRTIGEFFEKDRSTITWCFGRGIDRYASGVNAPIKLNPRARKLLD